MKDSTLLSSFALLIFCTLMIWLVRYLRADKIKRLEKEGLEVDFATQMNPWKAYLIGGCGAVIALLDIIRKLFYPN